MSIFSFNFAVVLCNINTISLIDVPAAVEWTDAGSGDRRGRGPGGGTGRGALPDHVVAGGIDEGEALDAPLVAVLASRYLSLDIQLYRRS